jgi:hypothetical protein
MVEDVTSNLWGNQTEKFYVFYQNSKFDQICSHVYFFRWTGELVGAKYWGPVQGKGAVHYRPGTTVIKLLCP